MLAAITIEFLKFRRSRTFRVVNILAALFPVLTAVVILTVRTSSELQAADDQTIRTLTSPDWVLFIQINTQMLTLGFGLMLFALMASFVFVREYAEGTYPSLLTLPVPRWRIVIAKFAALLAWMTFIACLQATLTLFFGFLFGVGAITAQAVLLALRYIVGTTLLFFLTVPMMSLLACLGRGYLAPMTVAVAALITSVPLLSSDLSVLLPWSIPVSYAAANATLEPLGAAILGLTFVAGVGGTLLHYYRADAR